MGRGVPPTPSPRIYGYSNFGEIHLRPPTKSRLYLYFEETVREFRFLHDGFVAS